jgi:hypothetical protein
MAMLGGCQSVLCTVQCDATASRAASRPGGTPPGTLIFKRDFVNPGGTVRCRCELGRDQQPVAVQPMAGQGPASAESGARAKRSDQQLYRCHRGVFAAGGGGLIGQHRLTAGAPFVVVHGRPLSSVRLSTTQPIQVTS